jgi:hypothetical protein
MGNGFIRHYSSNASAGVFCGGDVQGLGKPDCSTLVPAVSIKIPPNTGIVTKMAFGPSPRRQAQTR